MGFLDVHDASPHELEQQLRLCFRFGLATTADPQLWWDSFRYAVSLGHAHGLAGFIPDGAIALPVASGRVVSSRDVLRLGVSLPCLLGLVKKHQGGSRYTLTMPPSVLSAGWGARVRWELAMVQAFGITFPRVDARNGLGTELLHAVSEAASRATRQPSRRWARCSVYNRRMGALLANLREALSHSRHAEDLVLERRATFLPFPSSCSPQYLQSLLEYADVTLSDPTFHDTRDLLEGSLGMLRLRTLSAGARGGSSRQEESGAEDDSTEPQAGSSHLGPAGEVEGEADDRAR